MLQNLISSLKSNASNDPHTSRRSHPRRAIDRCVAVIHGRTFPVQNWSLGGILLTADERLFGQDQEIEITIKFKLRNNIMDVTHKGTVVRKHNGKVAIKFTALNQTISRKFQQVIDDHVAQEFAHSQA
jgi:hypothetical protein